MQQLPFAARQHFLEHGYAVLPDVLSRQTAARIRESVIATTTARSRYFADCPTVETLLKQSTSTISDPMLSTFVPRLRRRAMILRYYKKQRKENLRLRRMAAKIIGDRKRDELSSEELWKLSELLSQEVVKFAGKRCTSTIYNDSQMLSAINHYRANAWMTSKPLRDALLSDSAVRESLATLAEVVGGVENPVVFGDLPVLRHSFGNPIAYQCSAPRIGVRTNQSTTASAVSLFLITHEASPQCLAPHVLQHSHTFVRDQYIHRVRPSSLFSPFLPMEAHMPAVLRHFAFDASVRPRSLVLEGQTITPGSVLVADPHLLVAFSSNLTNRSESVYQLTVINEKSKPFLKAPSWVKGWRTMPHEVNYASPVVFPSLTKPPVNK